MTIQVLHKGFLLCETNSELEAWEKATKYGYWFTNIEVRGEAGKREAAHSVSGVSRRAHDR